MTRSHFAFFLGFGLLSACTGEGDCPDADCSAENPTGPDCEADCVDDTGEPADESATFVGPPVLFDGVQESCQTNLAAGDGTSYTVLTDEEIAVKPESYTLTFGDPALASSATDNLPLHVSGNGWLAISPPVALSVSDEETKRPSAPPMNLFIEGTWTCEHDDGFVENGTVTYTQGYLLYLPGVGDDIEVSGMSLDVIGGNYEQHGAFISDTWLYIESTGGMAGDFTADCWLGNADQDPR